MSKATERSFGKHHPRASGGAGGGTKKDGGPAKGSECITTEGTRHAAASAGSVVFVFYFLLRLWHGRAQAQPQHLPGTAGTSSRRRAQGGVRDSPRRRRMRDTGTSSSREPVSTTAPLLTDVDDATRARDGGRSGISVRRHRDPERRGQVIGRCSAAISVVDGETVFVVKRGKRVTGFSGVENPLGPQGQTCDLR